MNQPVSRRSDARTLGSQSKRCYKREREPAAVDIGDALKALRRHARSTRARASGSATPLAIALLFAFSACRQIVGFEDGPSSKSDAAGGTEYVSSSGLLPFADPVCGACIDQSCSAEARACAADSSCRAFEGCLAACARDALCAEGCLNRVPHADLSPETQFLDHCQVAACSAECPSLQVSAADGQMCGPRKVASACQACCCDEFAACDSDPECVSEYACISQCAPFDALGKPCFEACLGHAVDALNSHLFPAANCIFNLDGASRCQDKCFAADDWSCLGGVTWPDLSEGWGRVYGTVLDNPGGIPLEGFRVRGCVPRDACKEPIPMAETTSDPDGNFFLDLSQNYFGSAAYIEVTAPAGLDYPKHLFFEPPAVFNHASRWDFDVYIRESKNSVPLPDPSLGGVLFFAHDCSGRRAAGVEVTATPAGTSDVPAYVVPGFRANPNDTATLAAGIGFIVNLPPGQVILSSHRQTTQHELIGTTPIMIEADAMTIVDLVPTPL